MMPVGSATSSVDPLMFQPRKAPVTSPVTDSTAPASGTGNVNQAQVVSGSGPTVIIQGTVIGSIINVFA